MVVDGAGVHDVLLFSQLTFALPQDPESKLNPEGKRRTAGGVGRRAEGTTVHRRPVTALLARPVRDRRQETPAKHAREHLRAPTTRRPRTTVIWQRRTGGVSVQRFREASVIAATGVGAYYRPGRRNGRSLIGFDQAGPVRIEFSGVVECHATCGNGRLETRRLGTRITGRLGWLWQRCALRLRDIISRFVRCAALQIGGRLPRLACQKARISSRRGTSRRR